MSQPASRDRRGPAGAALKRAFDVAAAGSALVVLSPVMAVTAAVVRLSSPGPVLYRARRAGRDGRPYTMHKFRTMHHTSAEPGSRITATTDHRVFTAGRFLRQTKLDELPQLWDVLRGEMSIVGPRPEDPEIVDEHYTPAMLRTLDVRPGLTSPGGIFGTTQGPALLRGDDAESAYVERLLPIKLALELVYLERQSFAYDLRIIGRTMRAVAKAALGGRYFPDPPEMERARALLTSETGASPAA